MEERDSCGADDARRPAAGRDRRDGGAAPGSRRPPRAGAVRGALLVRALGPHGPAAVPLGGPEPSQRERVGRVRRPAAFRVRAARRPRARGGHAPVRRRPRRRRPGDRGEVPSRWLPGLHRRAAGPQQRHAAARRAGPRPRPAPRRRARRGRRRRPDGGPRRRPRPARARAGPGVPGPARRPRRDDRRPEPGAGGPGGRAGRDEHPVAATGVRHVRRRQPEGGARAVPAAGRRGADRRRGGRGPGRPGRRPGLVRPGALQPRLPRRGRARPRRRTCIGRAARPAPGSAARPAPPGRRRRPGRRRPAGRRPRRPRTRAATPARRPGRRPR